MLRLSKTFRFLIPVSAAFLVVPGMSTVAQAQQGSDEIEEIITTGTRRSERTASDSAIPIDVVTGQDFDLCQVQVDGVPVDGIFLWL